MCKKPRGQGVFSLERVDRMIAVARELGYKVELAAPINGEQWVNIIRPGECKCLSFFWGKVDVRTPLSCHCCDNIHCSHAPGQCRHKPLCCPSLVERVFSKCCCSGCRS